MYVEQVEAGVEADLIQLSKKLPNMKCQRGAPGADGAPGMNKWTEVLNTPTLDIESAADQRSPSF